jgi:hypothetical protein
MFSAGLEKQQAVTVALVHSVLPNHAFPCGGVSSNSRIKVTKNDELVGVGGGVDDIAEVLIELVFKLLWVGQSRSVCADNGGELSSSEGGGLIVIRRSFTPLGTLTSLPASVIFIAKSTPASRLSSAPRPLQKKV